MTVMALSIRLFCFAFIQELRLSTARVIKPGIADSITAPNPRLTFSVTFADFFRFDLCDILVDLLALENLSLGLIQAMPNINRQPREFVEIQPDLSLELSSVV